jgi:sigma-E factor negative regulatory protein RseB
MLARLPLSALSAPGSDWLRRAARCVGAGLACAVLPLVVAATPKSTPAPAPAASAPLADAPAVVRRIREAAQRRSYTGTFVVNSAGMMSSSRITHFADGRNQVERIEALDGQMRRIYRHNDAVHVLWPKTREASIEPRDLLAGFPAPSLTDGPLAPELYDLQANAADRVAGLDALVVTLKPRDQLRYPQRLWLERQSGLLLRADTLGARGEVLESAAFSELQLDPPIQAQALLQEMRRLDGYRIQKPLLQRSDLEREGWQLRNAPAGFVLVRCVRRPLHLPERASPRSAPPPSGIAALTAPAAPPPPADGGGLLQATYSDGLVLVSVFIEPFDGAVHQREGSASWGATQAWTRRLADWWVTVVGDVPLAALQQFSSGLEHRKP